MIASAQDETVDRILAETPYLRRFAFSLTRHDADADDLVQETVMRAFRAHGRLRPGSSLRAWLSTILRRVFLTTMQRRRRCPMQAWTDTGLPVDGVAATAAPVADAADFASVEQDLDDRLRRAVASVPLVYRDPMCRHALEGLTYREIAQRLDVPCGTVMSRIFRGRARVRRVLRGSTRDFGRGVR